MLKLYGFDVSNYYNMAKLAMALKGLEYQTVLTYPNQTPEFLALSPMGKVPVLKTDQGVLIESNVILEYLDSLTPDNPLYPSDPFEKARVQELAKMVELYLELPARRCFGEAFFGGTVADLTKTEAKKALLNGIQGLARAAEFSPYLAGDTFSAADIVFAFSADLAAGVAAKLFEIDLLAEAPEAKALLEKLYKMPEIQTINADKKAASGAFNKYIAESAAKK